ncbi:hypothetical protein JTB14_021601 [Gonioctena quinquepunctata]|nr:hypothetical protein JTB14_021601 [Gonioctena quinquepunctata]
MEIQNSPTPEETITSDIEKELISSSKRQEDHRHSTSEKKTNRKAESDAAVKRRKLSNIERKMLERLLGEYETALATVLRQKRERLPLLR